MLLYFLKCREISSGPCRGVMVAFAISFLCICVKKKLLNNSEKFSISENI